MQISNISNYSFNKANNSTNSSVIKQRDVMYQSNSINFTGKLPKSSFFKPVTDVFAKGLDKVTEGIAKGYASILKKDCAANLVNYTEKKKIDIVKHVMAGIGLVISGLYIVKTLKNKDLEPEKKTTLAINQGIVSVLATSLGYGVTGAMNKHIEKFVRKFSAANINHEELPVLRKGLSGAASMMVFSLMYRYVAPVLVTPVANSIGNKIQENKKAAAAAKSNFTA